MTIAVSILRPPKHPLTGLGAECSFGDFGERLGGRLGAFQVIGADQSDQAVDHLTVVKNPERLRGPRAAACLSSCQIATEISQHQLKLWKVCGVLGGSPCSGGDVWVRIEQGPAQAVDKIGCWEIACGEDGSVASVELYGIQQWSQGCDAGRAHLNDGSRNWPQLACVRKRGDEAA